MGTWTSTRLSEQAGRLGGEKWRTLQINENNAKEEEREQIFRQWLGVRGRESIT